jgi:hypothetical protein
MVLSTWFQKQTTEFVMEMADIPTTQETLNVKITNDGNAHHFL